MGVASWLDNRAPDGFVSKVLGRDYDTVNRRLSYVGIVMLSMILGSVVLWYATGYIRPTEYGQRGKDGGFIPLRTLATPVLTPERVSGWASKVVLNTLVYNFSNIDERLERARVYFDPDAYKAMLAAVNASGERSRVVGSRLYISVTPLQEPIVGVAGAKRNGEVYWEVQAPVLVTYTSASKQESRPVTITVTMKEVDTSVNPEGMVVVGFAPQNMAKE